MFRLTVLLEAAMEKEKTKWNPSCYSSEEDKQHLITANERKEAVTWLMEVNAKLGLSDESLFLAVAIMDKFLKVVKAHPKYLRCIGVSCLYVAAKTVEEDEMLPTTRELIHVSECSCSMKEIGRMECCILNQLKWDVNFVTPLHFLQLFYAMLGEKFRNVSVGCYLSPRYLQVMTKLLQNSLLHHQLLRYPPSVVGLSLLSLQLRMVWPYWQACVGHLQAIIQADETDVEKCCAILSILASDTLRMSVQAPAKKPVVTRKIVSRSKLLKHPASSQPPPCGSLKRKVPETGVDEAIYDGIKKLYAEDSNSNCSLDVAPHDSAKKQPLCTSFEVVASYLNQGNKNASCRRLV